MNILLVEDDESVHELLSMVLREAGHTVRAVSTVLPAFEILRRGTTDLILMDLGLPQLDGISFTRKLKTYPDLAVIPIVAMTGAPGKYLERSAHLAGCAAYLEKPVKTKELLSVIASLMPHEVKKESKKTPKG